MKDLNSQQPDGQPPYYYSPELELTLRVALAAERPLLLRGNPGTGKSTLAKHLAWRLDRRYHAEVVTSRTQAQDLLWRFDAVRRLADAQARRSLLNHGHASYVEPGILWRAFDPVSAAPFVVADDTGRVDSLDSVVLLDEIDKADPDVPNDLLVVLDERWFRVAETGDIVRARVGTNIFLVLTTNSERELPEAFLRRCIVFDLPDPEHETMKTIARLHHSGVAEDLLDAIWSALSELRARASAAKLRAPSTAEYLDALRACLAMKIARPDDPRWRRVMDATMWKHAASPRRPAQ